MSRTGTGAPIPRRRFGAWLVTGPLGRLAGFTLDLAAELLRAARRRLEGWIPRRPRGR